MWSELSFGEWVFAAAILFVLGGSGYAIYQSATSEKLVLTKSEWRCTETDVDLQVVTTTNANGTVSTTVLPVSVCTNYRKN